MTVTAVPMTHEELARILPAPDETGLGALTTDRGNLPLDEITVRTAITGLLARTELAQGFRNPYDVPLEATYIFPLPARAAVTAMRMEADGRVVDAELRERAEARATYDRAIAEGKRASIAEEERPDVFTMRVGNILPGERVTVRLTMVGPLPYADGEATYRLPLVVAPRYIPGTPLEGGQVGDGTVPDTDAVPDASRITPPVLLPGFPNPVRLAITVDVDPAGLPLGDVRSSLHAVTDTGGTLSIQPGERVNRDFLLRLGYGEAAATATALTLAGEGEDGGTFQLTVLPPVEAGAPRPRDVVLVLDRSGSMGGWKMVAARRAAARIVDTLTDADRFAVLTFDDRIDRPAGLPEGLVAATDRNRYRAVEHLARVDARGGTELLRPLRDSAAMLTDTERDRVLVLVTDGQVGNEDQLVAELAPALREVRVHAVGIDRAVNAGFLGRLAALGGGRCELVESEDRLDEATDRIHQRIGAPLVTGVGLAAEGLELVDVSPARLPAVFPGVPLVVRGRWRGTPSGAVVVTGTTAADEPWRLRVPATLAETDTLTPVWARAHLRDLEDAYAVGAAEPRALERQIVEASLRYGVLCRFTAFVAVDARVVTEGGVQHRVVQPVELPDGWEPQPTPMAGASVIPAAAMGGMAPKAMRASMVARDSMARPGGAPQPAVPQAAVPQPAPPIGAVNPVAAEYQPQVFGSMERERKMSPRREAFDPLADARAQAADEARRLRTSTAGTGGVAGEQHRRMALADLASRLDALLQHLTGRADEAALTPLRALSTALAACDGPNPPRSADLDALWQRALAALDAFAGKAPAAATGARPRGAFWKRG
jgi:Ca-activated chloride channel family protein